MKNLMLFAAGLIGSGLSAQFTVALQAGEGFTPKEVYVYKTSGSKDILISKEVMKSSGGMQMKVPDAYTGMMRLYFPEINYSLHFISENKDVSIKLHNGGGKVTDVQYLDEANSIMNEAQDLQKKREEILPALYQIKNYYKPTADFSLALDKEMERLSSPYTIPKGHAFIDFYTKNYNRFLVEDPTSAPVTSEEIINFITSSGPVLETSGLIRPILVSYLNKFAKSQNPETDINKLLNALTVESPRGQVVLSELIEIFDVYSMQALKDKYLAKAQNLKCTITDRLAYTIESNKNTAVGAILPDHTFVNPVNTAAKSIKGVKADKKVIVFWSSTCSHCETELPQFIPYYNTMKAKNIEVIGLSLDADKASYENKVKNFPWVNDTELRGWYSTFAEKYNIHATPTYFVVDSNNKIIAKPDHINDVFQFLGLK